VDLSVADAGAVDELSDLTGMLPPSENIDPYYTAYPLPSGQWYAFARTWQDNEVARAGCVITQTLLFSRSDEPAVKDLSGLLGLFAEDVHDCYSRIKGKLEPALLPFLRESASQLNSAWNPENAKNKQYLSALVRWFFATRTRPLVLFGNALRPSDIIHFRRLLWDEIRFRFSFCTLALQPITLPKSEFDLLIAPSIAETRFYKRGTAITPTNAPSNGEGWIRAYEHALFQQSETELMELYHLGRELDCLASDPVVLPLLGDLSRIIGRTPPEDLVGALTLIRRLAPGPEQGLRGKREFMTWALESVSRLTTASQSQFQQLTNVLVAGDTPELAEVFRECRGKAKEAVRRVLSRDLDTLVQMISDFEPDKLPPIEVEAVGETLSLATRNRSISVSSLPHDWAAVLLSSNNEFLEALYDSAPSEEFARIVSGSVSAITPERCHRLSAAIQTLALSRGDSNLLSTAYRFSDPKIAIQLFAELPEGPQSPLWSAAESFVEFHQTEAHEVAKQKLVELSGQRWRYLYVLSLPVGVGGFSEILDLISKDASQAEVLGMYLQRIGTQRIDPAVRNYISQNCDLISALIFRICEKPDPILSEPLGRLISDVPEINIASSPEILDCPGFQKLSFSEELISRSTGQAIRSYLQRKIPEATLTAWLSSPLTSQWFKSQSSREFQSLLLSSVTSKSAARLLKIVLLMPETFWERHPNILFDVIREHADGSSDTDFAALYESWSEVLKKLKRSEERMTLLKLRFYEVFRSLGLPGLAVSRFVVDGFSPVHHYLCLPDTDNRDMEPVLSFIPWPTWDKAKYLRKRLINSFLESHWPKTDLVQACDSPELLRKVLKRLRKSSAGEQFIQDLRRAMSRKPSEWESWRLAVVSDVAGGRNDVQEWV